MSYIRRIARLARTQRPVSLLLIASVAMAAATGRSASAQGTSKKPSPRKPAPATVPAKRDSVVPPPTPPVAPMAVITGTVFDSVHMHPLGNATVLIEGTPRVTETNERGRFRVDSVPPGTWRVRIHHVLLDSLGLAMATNPVDVVDHDEKNVELAIPSGESLVALSCPAARRALGPAAIIGRLLDADTDRPVDSGRVSFAWSEISLQSMRRVPRVRDALSGPDGVYRICGLPAQLEGTLQALKGGVSTAEVRVAIEGQALVIQGMKIGSAQTITRGEPDSTTKRPRDVSSGPLFSAPVVQRGTAVLNGKVIGATGNPIVGARVDVVGTPGATLTSEGGRFSLTGLPSGTQSVVVRQLGFAPVETAVELSTRGPATVTVTMSKPAQVLDPVVVTAGAQAGLDRVGFNQRKRMGAGTFITGEDILKRSPNSLTDVFRGVSGLRVEPVGSDYQITSSRNVMGGCVTYYVDGTPYDVLFPGDVDRIFPPEEIAAIEVYPSGNDVPAQFQQAGKTSCASIVMWSRTRTERLTGKRR